MADAETANLELVLPEVGASTDTWGTKLNSNFIALDAFFSESAVLLTTAGGTGLATYTAAGRLLYSTAATVLAALALGTARQLLQVNAGATAPEWASNIDIPGTLDVTGAVVLDSTLAVTGVSTFTGNVVAEVIRRGTSDASDNSSLALAGGGAALVARGAVFSLNGNESASTGTAYIGAGNVAGGIILFTTGDSVERLRISDAGVSTFAGDVVAATIRQSTSDGADNAVLALAGGGTASDSRGAIVAIHGNESATPGIFDVYAGNVAGAFFRVSTAATERFRISDAGVSTFAGDVVAATIRRSTSDGADSGNLVLAGGGAANLTRGAVVTLFGNEDAKEGRLELYAGGANGFITLATNSAEVARFDVSATATHTRFMIYDVDNATLERVTVGAADSGGAGFKLLRIAN